ncbi:MAG: CRISPR-associated RAMP protein [Alphaproteobacteria bacterium]|nr:CRISPR-associated RAMP protein [Alphaproteobacteria bacterium]
MSTPRRFVGFDRIVARHTLSARLVAKTAFRIGAGRSLDAVTTDLPVVRSGDDRLVVPGSSLKGVFRSAAEGLLASIGPRDGQDLACDLFADPCWKGTDEEERAWKREVDRLPVGERIRANRECLQSRLCQACATFGAPGLSAVIRFADALVEGARVSVRDGVGMSRDLGRAQDGLKYDFEVVEPGASIPLEIRFENAADWQVGLVLAVLDMIHEGEVRIGGFGSRGLGWFVKVEEPTVFRRGLQELLKRDEEKPKPMNLDVFRDALFIGLTEDRPLPVGPRPLEAR